MNAWSRLLAASLFVPIAAAIGFAQSCSGADSSDQLLSTYLNPNGRVLRFVQGGDSIRAYQDHGRDDATHRVCETGTSTVCIEGPRVHLYIPLPTVNAGYPERWEHGAYIYEGILSLGQLKAGRYTEANPANLGGIVVRRTSKQRPELPVMLTYFFKDGLVSFQEAELVTEKERACDDERRKGCRARTTTWYLAPGSAALGARATGD